MDNQNNKSGLAGLIQKGGVFAGIPGTNPREVLTSLLEIIPLPASAPRGELLKAVLEREALMSTAIGCGIALPHPRNPLVSRDEEQFLIIAFLKNPVDWRALDSLPVHTALLAVSSSPKQHLRTLSEINFFCQQESFRELLVKRSPQERIIKVIQEAERAWKSTTLS
ncbi:MAG: PTS sugar transporter subunit IIA [Treponema sp.]|jgi:PTS system nitrogen regulatory IIA component|nr:PTS sugar transporter subunit IIA [Treponema sp.]